MSFLLQLAQQVIDLEALPLDYQSNSMDVVKSCQITPPRALDT